MLLYIIHAIKKKEKYRSLPFYSYLPLFLFTFSYSYLVILVRCIVKFVKRIEVVYLSSYINTSALALFGFWMRPYPIVSIVCTKTTTVPVHSHLQIYIDLFSSPLNDINNHISRHFLKINETNFISGYTLRAHTSYS